MTNDERRGPPGIEPLSEAAWARVERGLWSRVDAELAVPARTARRWWLALAPLAVAAVIAIVVGVTRGGPERMAAEEPSRVVSGASPSAISFGDVHVELAPDTALAMSHETGQPIASLERGAAWFTVAPRGKRPPVLVRAGDATVTVIGTQFRVARTDERVEVTVAHGVVDVGYRGEHHAVSAGQRWSSVAASEVVSEVPASAPAESASAASTSAASASEPSTSAPSAHAASTPIPSASAPNASASSASAPSTATMPSTHTPSTHVPSAQAPNAASSSVSSSRASVSSAPPSPAADPAVDRDQAEYDRLTALEAQSSERAIAGYLALSRTSSAWAGPALFAAARLAVDRGDRRAVTLLDAYLKRFPAGANAADAQALRHRLVP